MSNRGEVLESGPWGESSSGQVKVQWLTLCYSSLRPEWHECDGRRHGIHLPQVSPENANYGRSQLQTLQSPWCPKSGKTVISRTITLTIFDQMLHWTNQKKEIMRIQIRNIGTKQIQVDKIKKSESGKTVISRAITLTIFDQMLHWTNQKYEIGRIQIRNIGTKQIQVNKIKKSDCSASLLKGGQTGGGRSWGSSEIVLGEKFSAIGSNALSTHGRIQLYPILPTHILFWLWKWPLKLKYLFFGGSFSQPTFKSKWVGETDYYQSSQYDHFRLKNELGHLYSCIECRDLF